MVELPVAPLWKNGDKFVTGRCITWRLQRRQQHRGEHVVKFQFVIIWCSVALFIQIIYKIVWRHRITGIIWPSKTRSKIDHTPLILIQCIFLERKMLRPLGLHGLEKCGGPIFSTYKPNKQDLCMCPQSKSSLQASLCQENYLHLSQ